MQTDHLDPFAYAYRSAETAGGDAANHATFDPAPALAMASPAGTTILAALPPSEELMMPDTHVIALSRASECSVPAQVGAETADAATDGLADLFAERERLREEGNSFPGPKTDEEMDEIYDLYRVKILAIDERIACTIASTPAGIFAQVKLLELICDQGGTRFLDGYNGGHSDEYIDRLRHGIEHGISRLAGADQVAIDTAADPVLILQEQYRRVDAGDRAADDAWVALAKADKPHQKEWELHLRLNEEGSELLEQMLHTPATSVDGVLAQLETLQEHCGHEAYLVWAIEALIAGLRGLFDGNPGPRATNPVVGLFKQWIDAVHEYDISDDREALARWSEIEERILAAPSLDHDTEALAIKVFINFRNRVAETWAPSSAQIRAVDCDEGDVEILRELARHSPLVAEFAEAVIHEDAVLIDTEFDIVWARERLMSGACETWEGRGRYMEKLRQALDIIALTPAKTKRGEQIKAWVTPERLQTLASELRQKSASAPVVLGDEVLLQALDRAAEAILTAMPDYRVELSFLPE